MFFKKRILCANHVKEAPAPDVEANISISMSVQEVEAGGSRVRKHCGVQCKTLPPQGRGGGGREGKGRGQNLNFKKTLKYSSTKEAKAGDLQSKLQNSQ